MRENKKLDNIDDLTMIPVKDEKKKLFQSKRNILIAILIVIGILALSTCVVAGTRYYKSKQNKEKDLPKVTQTPKPVATQVPTPDPTPTPDPHQGMAKSKITGEWIDEQIAQRRPIAVMLNNSKAGVPQNGLSSASVVYEATMEGNETRLMGIFEDYQAVSRLGSIRSCRPYFVYFALEFDAIYCHFGQAWVADEVLENSPVDNVSGLKTGSDAYYRSTDRKAPHNVFTDSQRMEDTITKLGYERNYASNYTGHYQLAADDQNVQLNEGNPAVYVKPGYPVNKPWFEYHEDDGCYYRFQYGSAQIDECTGQQVKFKNIILQYADSSIYAGSEYVNFDVLSGGNGMYITNGKAIDITWKKDSQYGITRYYDANGNEICLNQGKTWVCVMKNTQVNDIVLSQTVPQ